MTTRESLDTLKLEYPSQAPLLKSLDPGDLAMFLLEFRPYEQMIKACTGLSEATLARCLGLAAIRQLSLCGVKLDKNKDIMDELIAQDELSNQAR